MKRKAIKKFFALLAGLSCAFGVAVLSGCGTADSAGESGEITLVDFNDENIEAAFGETYSLELLALDQNGEYRVVKAAVKTAGGENVNVLNGKFVVSDKSGYVIEYSFGNYKRIVRLKVVASCKPIIEIDGDVSSVFCGEDYFIPDCNVTDYFDGQLQATRKIYKKTGEADTQVEFDVENNRLKTSEAGEYYVLYTATNSNGIKEEKKLPFYVRKTAERGEWDSFDDAGCIYSAEKRSGTKSFEYFEKFEGRNGVICMNLNGAVNNYASLWCIEPKSKEFSTYQGYNYIAVPVYIQGNVNNLLNVRVLKDCLLTDVKSGEWVTYYFDASGWTEERFNAAVGANATTDGKSATVATGSVFGDIKIYIDSIYFTNEADVACAFSESENGVTPVFSATEMPDGYKVSYHGREVPVADGKFKADRAGDFIVQPLYYNTDKICLRYFTYRSTGADTIKLNDYDKEVTSAQEDYALPEISIIDGTDNVVTDDYEISVNILYTDTLGEKKEVREFNRNKKGWYTYTFTACKDNAKTLEKIVTVKAGDFIAGEILNVSDDNAEKRFNAMFTGGKFEKITLTDALNETEKLPAEYIGNTFVKLAYDTQYTYTTNNSYINFNSVIARQEVNDCLENRVVWNFYVKAVKADGAAEIPEVTFDFLGEKYLLKLNGWNTVKCSYAALYANYNKLALHATWADYVAWITTKIREFSELTFYFGDVRMIEETDKPYAVRVTEENLPFIGNTDIPGAFAAKDGAEICDFTGGYTGNAVKMYIDTNPNYRLKNVYKPSQLNEYSKEYNTVSLWVAVNGVKEGGSAYFMQAGGKNFIGKAFGSNYRFTSNENGKWKKLSISMQAYINLLAENNYTHCPLASIWVESAVADKGEKAYIYFGNVEFSYVAPSAQFKIIDVETAPGSYAFYDGSRNYYTNAPESVPALTGDYSGAVTAIKFEQGKPWYVKNPFANAAEFAEYSAYYNTVSFYVGYIHDGDGYKTVYPSQTVGQDAQDDPTALLYYTQEKMLTLEDGKWVKVSVTMADFAKWLEENNYANLCKIGANRYTSKSPMIYFGDMYFENV